MIEGAELLEIFQWNNSSLEEIKNNPEKINSIQKELADVMVYCFDMAVLLDLDMEQILNDKLDHVKEKYPTHLFNKDSKTKDPGNEDAYWKIKQNYRNELFSSTR